MDNNREEGVVSVFNTSSAVLKVRDSNILVPYVFVGFYLFLEECTIYCHSSNHNKMVKYITLSN